MNLRFIDWIWHVRGTLALGPDTSGDEALDRLAPLFHERGTTHQRTGQTLVFSKKDQAAQDKMAVFDSGVLKVEPGVAGPVLRYHLISKALLFCFLAPLLFLGFAQLTIAVSKFDKPAAEAKADAAKKKAEKEKAQPPQNWIDKALGAPAPEKPDKKKDKGKDDDKPKTTPAYVFAGIFVALYVIGRILESKLVKSLFRRKLAAAQTDEVRTEGFGQRLDALRQA